MNPLRMPLLLCVLASLASPCLADLTMNGRSTVVAMGMQGSGQEKIWLDKTLIRRDMLDRGKAYSNLFDLKAKEVTVLDHSLRQATVYSTGDLKQETDAAVDSKAIKLEVKPTGRTHMLQKWDCAENTIRLSMPAEIGGEKLDFEMAGTIWLARNTKELLEFADVFRQGIAGAGPRHQRGHPPHRPHGDAVQRRRVAAIRRHGAHRAVVTEAGQPYQPHLRRLQH